jgi:hypothetical protein
VFDSTRIERVRLRSGAVEVLYTSADGACCGVVTCSPTRDEVVFIHGPERPTPEWSYGGAHRRGALLRPGETTARNLDARDLTPPFTPGALRGGTHLHTFSGDGEWVAFTYQDAVLPSTVADHGRPGVDLDRRAVGVSVPGAVTVPRTHPRNHDGSHFSVLVTRVVSDPVPGSDEIAKAYSDAWVGSRGCAGQADRCGQRAIAFLGDVRREDGLVFPEVFVVDLPDDLTRPGRFGPLEGTTERRPAPPQGIVQRRLTMTAGNPVPGVRGPRYWPRSSADGRSIAFLMPDRNGTVQLWRVPFAGGDVQKLTDNRTPVTSAFSWHPDGEYLAYVTDGRVAVTRVRDGRTVFLTTACGNGEFPPRPEACVFAPDGAWIAFVRPVRDSVGVHNQVFTVPFEGVDSGVRG